MKPSDEQPTEQEFNEVLTKIKDDMPPLTAEQIQTAKTQTRGEIADALIGLIK